MTKRLRVEKSETHYRVELDASEYDFLEVVMAQDERITIKFLDTRWRTVEETTSMLREIIEALEGFGTTTKPNDGSRPQ